MGLYKTLESGKLNIRVYNCPETMGREAAKDVADRICTFLDTKKEVNILFAAAPSQNTFLESLTEELDVGWKRVNAFQMDEFVGFDRDTRGSFGSYLKSAIFEKLGFKTVNYINGKAEDIDKECKRYSGLIERYPPDIVCVGIGENGHIAMNDPGEAHFEDSRLVRAVNIDEKSRIQQVHDCIFTNIGDVPQKAITLTVPALMSGSGIFCIVPFSAKNNAVLNTVYGEVSEKCPASILRKHDNAVLYTDQESAGTVVYMMSGMIWEEM